MGKMKEQQEQTYLSNGQNSTDGLSKPTFIGLIDIIKNLLSLDDSKFNFAENSFNFELEKYNPNQVRFFNAEAI